MKCKLQTPYMYKGVGKVHWPVTQLVSEAWLVVKMSKSKDNGLIRLLARNLAAYTTSYKKLAER